MTDNKLLRLLTYVTGLVNQELLLQNEYLAAENRILRAHLPARMRLSDPERSTLAEIGKRLGRKALEQVTCVAKPDTILGWYRKLIARKFDGSRHRSYPGRPRIAPELEALVVRIARDCRDLFLEEVTQFYHVQLDRHTSRCSALGARPRRPGAPKTRPRINDLWIRLYPNAVRTSPRPKQVHMIQHDRPKAIH
jgi:hypothetical protein